MKLEVGMYVRTKRGQIGKIITIGKDNVAIEFNRMWQDVISKTNIVKEPSFNIFDLIEVGDYVNGHQVYEVDRKCCRITLNGGEYGDEFRITYLRPALGKNMGIKSIVTKEQFKNMEYIVE